MRFNNLICIFLNLVLVSFLSCTKDAPKPDPVPVLPTITTTDITAITTTSASSGGNISSDGGAAITSRGVCYGLSTNPTVADTKTSDGTGLGNFTSSILELIPGTAYHVRAYAKNSVGVAYGLDVSFITTAIMHKVTIISGANGAATAPNSVANGSEFKVTAVPAIGFKTDFIDVNGVKFNLNGANSYTVINNIKPPVVSVTFKTDTLWILLEKPWVEVLIQERYHIKGGPWTTEYHEGKFHVEKYDFHANGMVTTYLDGNQGADRKYKLEGDSLFIGIYSTGYGGAYKIIKITRDSLIIRQVVEYWDLKEEKLDPTKDVDVQKTFKH